MGKNGYLQRQRNTVNVYRQAEKETYIQFMTDTLILTLNDPAVMGRMSLAKSASAAWWRRGARSSTSTTALWRRVTSRTIGRSRWT